MKPIVEIHNLSKKYLLASGQMQGIHNTLVDTLSNYTRKLLNRLKGKPSFCVPDEEFYALSAINLTIQEGDRLGIIGRNGAGKSTLLKILSRIIEPTSGHVKIRGRVSSLLEVGTGFHPELTGKENIYLNGAILGMSHREIKKKFDEIVAFAEVEKFLDTPVKRFSSGMYTRLGFAIAAHLDPDLLIIDEVLAVGDAQFQSKCLKKLNDLGMKGRTVLFVSHDVGAVLNLCNQGIYLEKGKLMEAGPIDLCVNAYMKSYAFSSMNWEGVAGDEHLKIYSASLALDNPLQEFFYQGSKTELKITYEVFKPTPGLYLSFNVFNQRNQLLARSDTTQDPENPEKFFAEGKHTLAFELDVGLFHEGEYVIQVECALHNRKKIVTDEILLKFPVYNRRKNSPFTHVRNSGSGIFLGHHWKLQSQFSF